MEIDTKKIGVLASKLLGKVAQDRDFKGLTNLELDLVYLQAIIIRGNIGFLEGYSSDLRDRG